MEQVFPFLGAWFWWVAAGLMLIAELVLPGILFIWLACAALVVGLVDVVFQLSWQNEVMLFCVMAVVFTLTGWPLLRRFRNPKSDQPHLNQRMETMVGRAYTLEQAMENGRGKLRIGDTLWEVEGPNAAAGATVRVIATAGMKLVVEAA